MLKGVEYCDTVAGLESILLEKLVVVDIHVYIDLLAGFVLDFERLTNKGGETDDLGQENPVMFDYEPLPGLFVVTRCGLMIPRRVREVRKA